MKNFEFCRQLAPEEIAKIISKIRNNMGWKQDTLAHEAHTTLRTIQRAENGEKVSDITLKSIAKAIKLPSDTFTKDYFIYTDNCLEQILFSLENNYERFPLRALNDADSIKELFRTMAWQWQIGNPNNKSETKLAELNDMLSDYRVVFYDCMTAMQQQEAITIILSLIKSIENDGLSLKYGMVKRKLKNFNHAEADIGVIFVTEINTVLFHAMYPNGAIDAVI